MKFFQTLIASTLGVFIALFIFFILFLVTLAGSTSEPEPYVQNNTVLKIDLRGNIPARSSGNPFDELLNPGAAAGVSLETLRNNLAKASQQDNIKGVWLEIDFISSGWANLEEAHRLISNFRDQSGKFVYASTNDIGYNEQGYFLATAADSIFSPAESFFEFDGFYSQVTFYTGFFEKIGIQFEVARHGEYKSAIEPYTTDRLSDESEYQLSRLLEDITAAFVSAVSTKTGKSPDEVNGLLNSTPTLMATEGYAEGLIDSLLYPDEVEALIKRRMGLNENSRLNTISNSRYSRVSPSSAGLSQSGRDKIAVLYANGPIIYEVSSGSPFGTQQYITASNFDEQLEAIRSDEHVKAVVIRINSPGGSASTSDLIWRQINELSADLPIVASMGPVAASGGYYIAMAADTIVAESTSITGSIGVFATKFNASGLLNDQLGITFDEVKSHPYADWLNPTRGFTEAERMAYQRFVDDFYNTFITKVSRSRDLTVQQVDAIAQGRVWSGRDAMDERLVDMMGGLDDAISVAADMADIEDYSIENFPKPESLFDLFLGSAQAKVRSVLVGSIFSTENTVQELDNLLRYGKSDPMLIFPYDLSIH